MPAAQRRRILAGGLAVALAAALVSDRADAAESRRTIAVVPFIAESGLPDWLVPALTDAAWIRLHRRADVNNISPRQMRAAMGQVGLGDARIAHPPTAAMLARQLGADLIVTGALRHAAGGSAGKGKGQIEITIRVIESEGASIQLWRTASATLDDPIGIEAEIAAVIASALGEADPRPDPGGFGTRSAVAFEKASLALAILSDQSLSPAAADPDAVAPLAPKDLDRAADLTIAAREADRSYSRVHVAQALIDALRGDFAASGASLAKAKGEDPMIPLVSAFVHMRQGRIDDAEAVFRSAIEGHPGFLHARGSLGGLYARYGRFRESRATFQSYLEIAPKNPWVLAQIAYAEARLGKASDAVALTRKAIDLSPDSAFLWIELAGRHIDARDTGAAAEALETAISLEPDAAIAYVRLGYVRLLSGDDKGCIAASEQALERIELSASPANRRAAGYAYLNLARAHGHAGDATRALELLRAAKGHGITDFREVEGDPALAGLRARAEYGQIVD